RPRAFQAAGDRVGAFAVAVRALPAEALVLHGGGFRLGTDVPGGGGRPVRLAERVAADDEGDCLLVVHRHAGKGLADVPGSLQRVRVAAGPFGVHVDQAHLHGAERLRELAVPAVARVAQPRVLRAPEEVLGLPDVGPAEAEAEGLEPHRFHGHVAGQDQQIGPGDLLAVLLLEGPEEPARLVEVRVVGPAVQRREALLTFAATPTAV